LAESKERRAGIGVLRKPARRIGFIYA